MQVNWGSLLPCIPQTLYWSGMDCNLLEQIGACRINSYFGELTNPSSIHVGLQHIDTYRIMHTYIQNHVCLIQTYRWSVIHTCLPTNIHTWFWFFWILGFPNVQNFHISGISVYLKIQKFWKYGSSRNPEILDIWKSGNPQILKPCVIVGRNICMYVCS